MAKPLPQWTTEEFEQQRVVSRDAFRAHRIDEPVELYNEEFELAWQQVNELLERTIDLTDVTSDIVALIRDDKLRRAFRYTTGPPISEDDLKLLAETKLSAKYFADHPESYEVISQMILLLLDRKRFPWVGEDRTPEPSERDAATLATAAQIAAQSMTAKRRNQARGLEDEVSEALVAAGYTKVDKRTVASAADWPSPGTFCGEGKVAERQADLIVTLFDGRYMPIECKVSASEINSLKRLNNDSLGKFTTWTNFFGVGQTLPVAVLKGTFKLTRLQEAQNAGAGIFWGHDLASLGAFAESEGSPGSH